MSYKDFNETQTIDSINVTNDATISGDVIYTTSGAGNLFGEISAKDSATTTTFAGTTETNKSQVLIFDTNGLSNGTTPDHTNDHITIDTTGIYLVTVSMVIESTVAVSTAIGSAVYKNNGSTQFANVHMNRQLSGTNDKGSTSMSGIISLSATDTLELWIWNDTNTNAIIVSDVTLSVLQIGA